MSFIHYKLITNKNFEKITFDGVSLSVSDLKKQILEKKFRKQSAIPQQNGISTGSMPNKKSADVDLEITNADTNEVYHRDTDLIPKNSRVRINRVVKSIGPAIAGGTVTSTQKQKEQLVNARQRFNNYAYSSPNASPVNEFLGHEKRNDDSLYSDFNMNDDSNSNSSNSLSLSEYTSIQSVNNSECISPLVTGASVYDDIKRQINTKIKVTIPSQKIIKTQLEVSGADDIERLQSPPSSELLCPFMDETSHLHLMDNAILVPCCGYFICCESCIRDRLEKHSFLECPHEACIQEITSSHRLTPYKPIRQKVKEYLAINPSFTTLDIPPASMIYIKPKKLSSVDSTKSKQENTSTFTPVKINLPGSKASNATKQSRSRTPEIPQTLDLEENKKEENENEMIENDRSRSKSEASTPVSSRSSSKTSRSRSNSSSSVNSSEVNSEKSAKTSLQDTDLSETEITVSPNIKPKVTDLINQTQGQPYANPPPGFQNQPPPQFGMPNAQYMNHPPPMEQIYYNQSYIPQQVNHNQQIGFNNYTKQLAPPPGTESFIQQYYQQTQFIPGTFNQHYNLTYPPHFQQHLGPNEYQNQFQRGSYSNQWNQPTSQPNVIDAPISIHPTHRQHYSSQNRHHYQNASKYRSHRSRTRSRSRSRRSRSKKHKRKHFNNRSCSHSRSRSKSRKHRSGSRHKRVRYEGRKSSRDRRTRTRSRSHSYHKTEHKDKRVKNDYLKFSSRSIKRDRSTSTDRKRTHSKKRSRSHKDDYKREKEPKKVDDGKKLTREDGNMSDKRHKTQIPWKIENEENEHEMENNIFKSLKTNGHNIFDKKCETTDKIQNTSKSLNESVEQAHNETMNKQDSELDSSTLNTGNFKPGSVSSSPSKKSKPKRTVFLKQNIYQQAQANVPKITLNIPKISPSLIEEKPAQTNEMHLKKEILKESNQISQIMGYLDEKKSESVRIIEDPDFLDINISDNLNISLA